MQRCDVETYISSRYRSHSRHEEQHRDEECPETGVDIDPIAKRAHMPRSSLETTKSQFAADRNDVTQIKYSCSNIEHG